MDEKAFWERWSKLPVLTQVEAEAFRSKANYRNYASTPHWRAIRAFAFEYEPFCRCALCQHVGGNALQLHHVSYKNLGFETPADLRPLCKSCHERIHAHLNDNGLAVWHTDAVIKELAGHQLVKVVRRSKKVRCSHRNKSKAKQRCLCGNMKPKNLPRCRVCRRGPKHPDWSPRQQSVSDATFHAPAAPRPIKTKPPPNPAKVHCVICGAWGTVNGKYCLKCSGRVAAAMARLP